MVSTNCFKCMRGMRSICLPLTTTIGFTLMLCYIMVLYHPGRGPGLAQKIGWQAWEAINIPKTGEVHSSPAAGTGHDEHKTGGVDWWNVTDVPEVIDYSSFPLDVWSPLLPHDTGLSAIEVTRCVVDPVIAGDYCAPRSTMEQDAILGKWVRVPRDLNIEGSYYGGFVNIYYRRTRRQDINVITDIILLEENKVPDDPKGWHSTSVSVRTGSRGSLTPMYIWYKTGKTGYDMNPEEKSNIITELDVLYGEDAPWYGFEKLEPPAIPESRNIEATWITYRRGVKLPPRAPPLHFSHNGKFKILQVADLHYSVSRGVCRDTSLTPCTSSDNLTTTLISHMIEAENPDLIVFTGDQLNGQMTTWDAKSVIAKFARIVEEKKIPWAVVFGNHDAEDGMSKETQMGLYKGLPYNVVEPGPKDVHGAGNYVLKVFSADASKTQILTLYFLDSGDYLPSTWDWLPFSHSNEYDWIRQSQIDWFLQESASIQQIERPFYPDTGKDLSNVWPRQSDQITPVAQKLAKPNAMMFFHIPLPQTFSKVDISPLTGKPLDVGISDQEGASHAQHDDGFFEKGILYAQESNHVASKSIPEVKVIGNGHQHLTENCRRIKGVWLCFGGGGSYSGYGKVGFDRRFRVYEISDFGETIRTWKRTEKDEILDEMCLAGRNAAPFSRR
ncbi:Metallo-dependent phosphatase [Crepidotus variabilis]|uniref:Metallo-dependent phosphatase n=1 Tax=Crepidotus variabilis TaxID=179855 RepID=A0A9P6EMW9_9AGAR|nr:Metallo-dependent phosphatase [Crepidotus variabilis]